MIRRASLIALGWVLVALGAIGLVVPMMPGTLFLILAAACFTRSSPRFEHWLLHHRWFGPPVRQWRSTGAIAPHIKIVICGSMAFSLFVMWHVDVPLIALVSAFICIAVTAAYVLTRPSV